MVITIFTLQICLDISFSWPPSFVSSLAFWLCLIIFYFPIWKLWKLLKTFHQAIVDSPSALLHVVTSYFISISFISQWIYFFLHDNPSQLSRSAVAPILIFHSLKLSFTDFPNSILVSLWTCKNAVIWLSCKDLYHSLSLVEI